MHNEFLYIQRNAHYTCPLEIGNVTSIVNMQGIQGSVGWGADRATDPGLFRMTVDRNPLKADHTERGVGT